MAENKRERYSELDWLRVILIVAVFTHHVLMPFNGDGWHIVNPDSSKILDDVMVFFEQIRLQALFFIAGEGSLVLLQKTMLSFDTNHLWFIEFLIVFMLLAIPIKRGINSHFGASIIVSIERLAARRHGFFAIATALDAMVDALQFGIMVRPTSNAWIRNRILQEDA